MKCPTCGAQIPDGITDCSHYEAAQTTTNDVDPIPLHSPVQPIPPATYQGHLAQSASMPFIPTPAYAVSLPSQPTKKTLRTIVIVAVIASIVVYALVGFFYLNLLTTTQSLHKQSTMKIGTQATFNTYTGQIETLALNDSLLDNSIGEQNNYHWMDATDTTAGADDANDCYFADNGYHVSTNGQPSQDTEVYCLTLGTHFSDFTYQMRMNIQKGHMGGIIFRQSPGAHFYAFAISDTGDYILFANDGSDATLLAKGSTNSINQQAGIDNILAVVANRDKLDVYVNQSRVASVVDSTYSVGLIGVIALGSDDSPSTEMAFHNATVWIKSKERY